MKERLKEIAGKSASNITAEDKAFVAETCASLGVELNVRGNCKQCYADAAVECWKKLRDADPQEVSEDDGRKYILRAGVRVRFNGRRVNEAMITDEVARKLIARGFPKKYFAKCE